MTLKHVYHFSASLDLVCLKTSFSVRTIVLFISDIYCRILFALVIRLFFLTRSNINWPFYITTLLRYLHKLYRVLGEGLCIFLQWSRPSYPNELTVCFYCYARSFTSTKYFFPLFPRKNDCISDSYKLTSKKSTRRLKQLRGTRIPFEF